jgi:hypothetical protein
MDIQRYRSHSLLLPVDDDGENWWANDIDGSALTAQPGKSQGRPLKSPGSKPIAQNVPAQPAFSRRPLSQSTEPKPPTDDTDTFKAQFHAANRSGARTPPDSPRRMGAASPSVAIADSHWRMGSVAAASIQSPGTKSQAPTARKGCDSVALGFYFTPSGFTAELYDEAIRRLEEAGAGAPAGRSNHFALETNGEIQVFDVWESQEAFEAFGATLVPIMAELGADPGQPMVARVHNVIDG